MERGILRGENRASRARVFLEPKTELETDPDFGQEATIADHSGEIFGTSGDDVIIGNDRRNIVYPEGGKDRICTGGGNDLINLADVDDPALDLMAHGGDGDDRIMEFYGSVQQGYAGRSYLVGGRGNDYLWAGSGGSTIFGGPGNDTVKGEEGSDVLRGGGDDEISGWHGDDELYGEAGFDTLDGGADVATCQVGPDGGTSQRCEKI